MCSKHFPCLILICFCFVFQSVVFADIMHSGTFKRVFNNEAGDISILKVVMSKDGRIVIFHGRDNENKPVLCRCNSDGTEFINFTLPQYVIDIFGGIFDITISGDGNIAYFAAGLRIYKVVSLSVMEIFDSAENEDDAIHQFRNLQTNYVGNSVYFLLNDDFRRGSLWELDSEGLLPIMVVDPTDVIHKWGKGGGLDTYALSEVSGKIAFTLRGYWDEYNNFFEEHILVAKTGPLSYKKFDFDGNLNITFVDISGMGNRIVYHRQNSAEEFHYFAIDIDGSNETQLGQIVTPGWSDMNYDGTEIIFSGGTSNGRLTKTYDITELDVIPFDSDNGSITMSTDNKVCLVSNRAGIKGVYVGSLDWCYNNTCPKIDELIIEPEFFPKNDKNAEIKMTIEFSNPENLKEVKTEIFYNGLNQGVGYGCSQVYFPHQPNDWGLYGDDVAGDGIYTSIGKATTSFDSSHIYNDIVYTRIIAQNTDGGFTYRDVTFDIKNAVEIEKEEGQNIPENFELTQNYPNPFNPTTKIKYSIPNDCFVTMKLYNVVGQEIKTLIHENKNAGYHVLKFDGSGLSSGVYFYKILIDDFVNTKKFILLK